MDRTSAPWGSSDHSISSRQKQEWEGIFKRAAVTAVSFLMAKNGEILPSSCRTVKQTVLNMLENWGKDVGSCDVCWEECTGVITHWVMQEWFGGNLCLVQSWASASFCTGVTHTLKHGSSRSCPEDLLITLSERESLRHEEGQPTRVITHTHHWDSSSFFSILLFLAFIYDFFPKRPEAYGRHTLGYDSY